VWVGVLEDVGYSDVVHWSSIGLQDAPDVAIFEWARKHGFVIITHDLDFGNLLALTRAKEPSVILFRAEDITPTHLAKSLTIVLQTYSSELDKGALIVLDDLKTRVRVLPLR